MMTYNAVLIRDATSVSATFRCEAAHQQTWTHSREFRICINLALLVSACEASFDAEPAPQRVVSVNGRRQRSRSPCPDLFAWRKYRLPSRRYQAGRLGRRRLRLQLPPHCRITIPQAQRLRQHHRLKSQDCWWKPPAPHRTPKKCSSSDSSSPAKDSSRPITIREGTDNLRGFRVLSVLKETVPVLKDMALELAAAPALAADSIMTTKEEGSDSRQAPTSPLFDAYDREKAENLEIVEAWDFPNASKSDLRR